MDKIQITEEQARQLYDHTVSDSFTNQKQFIARCKERGYIKRSDLEIAKEKFHIAYNIKAMPESILNYIIELEKEIERLKNER